jgi:vacuolar-type H+-ATPase subunit I/STV1
MLSIVFGLISLSLGLWGMLKFWWYMVDVLIALLPMLLIFGGAIALMAGIRNTGIRTSSHVRKSAPLNPEPAARKSDE